MFLLCTLVGNILLRTCSTEQEREEDAKCSDFCDQNQLKPADLSLPTILFSNFDCEGKNGGGGR